MAMHTGPNSHTAADLLRQAVAQNNARHENRDEMHDHLGSNSPTPSGVETPRPDLQSDKRLPGIPNTYFGQVGNTSSSRLSPSHTRSAPAILASLGLASPPMRRVKSSPRSQRSSSSSGSLVMVAGSPSHADNAPHLPEELSQKTGTNLPHSATTYLPLTPISSSSSLLQRNGDVAENGRPLAESGIASVTQALRNFLLPKSSFRLKARRHQSLPVSGVTGQSVPAAHISNPTTSLPSPAPQSPQIPPLEQFDKSANFSANFPVSQEHELTSDATAESRTKNTPPLTPRALSHEGGFRDKRSPLSSTSSTASKDDQPTDQERLASSRTSNRGQGLPPNTARGKLAVKIAEARNIKPCYDPYVVCVFEWNEYISKGPKHDAMDLDVEEGMPRPEAPTSVPIRRTDSDMGRPMAIPMKSRQSSNNGLGETHDPRSPLKVADPQWNHEAMFDVLGVNSEIDISVYDKSNHDAFLGHVRLCLNLTERNPVLENWFALEPRGEQDDGITGEIHIKMHFTKTDKRNFGPNDFQILKLIGKGTFGQVYQVRKKDTQRIYAMKVLSKKVIIQKKEVAHTLGERNILVRTAMADSPFIVGLKFSFQTPTDLYLVTDFMSGGELFWHLQKEGRFVEERAKFYIAELILALQHLHQHDIVYRDLKPENILLDANGHIALCDFGLSKANLAKNDTTNTFCGTTEYLAPEVLLDEQGYTKMVDFWSLGVLVFEMCCGWSPFYAEDTQQMYKNIAFGKVRFPRDALSTEGRNFVKGLLNRNPKHRLGANRDAQELIEHPFFADVDWIALGEKRLIPPFKPKLDSAMDTQNFDPEFTTALDTSSSLNARAVALAAGVAPASTPLSPTMQDAFRGFTFVDESNLDSLFQSRNGNGEDDEDGAMLKPSLTRENRMSGVQRTGNDDNIFNDNWDM